MPKVIAEEADEGVHLEEPRSGAAMWVATWYEPGKGRCRAEFRFGAPRTRFPTSEAAYAAAKRRREEEAQKWYTYIEPKKIQEAYAQSGSLAGAAKALGISYPTAQKWAAELGLETKRQGYTPPEAPITGLQCRHGREALAMTRDEFCRAAGVGKTALQRFELGKARLRESSMVKVMRVFERYRVVFRPDGTFEMGA